MGRRSFWVMFGFAGLFGAPAFAALGWLGVNFALGFPMWAAFVFALTPLVSSAAFFGSVVLLAHREGRKNDSTEHPVPQTFWQKIAASRSVRRLTITVFSLTIFLMILNPGRSEVTVQGPTGVIRTEKWSFGYGSFVVGGRVIADEDSVTIEHR